MSGRIVRASKYRHVYGQLAKKELYYDHIKLTINAFDSNLIKVNPKYISVNWNAIGGGAFAVIPLEEFGKLQDQIPLFRGHQGPVLDTDWNPFDDDVVASGSDDGKIALWRVPEGYTTRTHDSDEIKDIKPYKILEGHTRKVGVVQWHPTAENILASCSADYSIKIWDTVKGEVLFTLQQDDLISSFTFNYDGSLIATTGREKKIRVWDIRKETIISEGPGHDGIKSSRVLWLGKHNRLITTGFSKLSDRQLALWDASDIAKGPLGGFQYLDGSAGFLMPFYDEDTSCLYLGGKGDGNIRYYEYKDDKLYFLSEYQSAEPQRGLAYMPKRGLNIRDHEVVRIYKTVNDSTIQPISFIVPKKSPTFQGDIYPDTRAGEPALTAEEWVSGKTKEPKLISVKDLFDGHDVVAFEAKKEEPKEESKEDPKEEPKVEPKEEVEQLSKEEPKEAPAESADTKHELKAPKDTAELFSTPGIQDFLKKNSEEEGGDEIKSTFSDDASSWDVVDSKDADIKEGDTNEPKAAEAESKEVEPKEVESKEVEPKEVESKEVESKEVESKEVEPKEVEPKEVEPKEVEPKEAEASKPETKSAEAKEPATKAVDEPSAESPSDSSHPLSSVVDKLEKKIHELSSKLENVFEELEKRDRRIGDLESKFLGNL